MIKKQRVTFFIEGQEHVRFVEMYMLICKNLGFDITVASLENLEFNVEVSEIKINVILKSNLRSYFTNINTDWLFTTTPGVGSFYFPKSKNKNKTKKTRYVYLFHSLVSPNQVYIKNSFSKFDVILSPNKIITEQLIFITSKKAKIYTVGYPALNHYTDGTNASNAGRVLIAPSWGEDSFLFDYEFMESLTRVILNKDSKITIRPHPMHIERLKNDEKLKMLNVDFDFNKNLNNLNDFELLITDWSGIALEYYYLSNGKIIFVDGVKKIRRKLTSKENSIELIEDKIRKIMGVILKRNESIQNIYTNNVLITKNCEEYINSLYTPKFNFEDVSKIIKNFIKV
jgi:hypothetical protein